MFILHPKSEMQMVAWLHKHFQLIMKKLLFLLFFSLVLFSAAPGAMLWSSGHFGSCSQGCKGLLVSLWIRSPLHERNKESRGFDCAISSCSCDGMSCNCPSVMDGKAINPVPRSLSFRFTFKWVWRWKGVLGRKSKARTRHCKRFQWIPISHAWELGTGLKITLINENVSSKDTPSTRIYSSHCMQSCSWYTVPLLLTLHICKLIFQTCTLGYITLWQARPSPLCVHTGSVSRRRIKRVN